MTMNNVPASLSIITFSRLPSGSYLTVGTPYLVTHDGSGGEVYFRNVETGSGTSDRAVMVNRSVWEQVTDRFELSSLAVKVDNAFERNLRAAGLDRWTDAKKWPAVAVQWFDVKRACDAAMHLAFQA